jgi:hypothetical protein
MLDLMVNGPSRGTQQKAAQLIGNVRLETHAKGLAR